MEIHLAQMLQKWGFGDYMKRIEGERTRTFRRKEGESVIRGKLA